jgi:hypothetical protein
MAKDPDRWHRWLMDVRFGGDAAVRERMLTESQVILAGFAGGRGEPGHRLPR